MDKIKLLRQRRETLKNAGVGVRADISAFVDADSFVELSAFSFSKDAFYGEDAQGEGVVTGFATVGGYPFYIVAQNYEVSYGGLSAAACKKIAKTLDAAEKNDTPVVYLLHSLGVRVGEGIEVLEGIASLLMKATGLKGTVLQFAVLTGEAYGSTAALASVCDAVFFTEKSVLSVTSPLVLSAKAGKNLKAEQVGGYQALKNAVLPTVCVDGLKEAAEKIVNICDLVSVSEEDADLNAPAPELNKKADAKALCGLLEKSVELGANTCPEIKTILGRLGGISVAAAIFDQTTLNAANLKKLRDFVEFASCYGLPFVSFVDCLGVEQTLQANDSPMLKQIAEYLSVLDTVDTAKIAVVTGKAVGLGYSLLAAKSAGFDYTVALATAQISLFESAAGAQIEYGNDKKLDADKLRARYEEEIADPFSAAKGGYLDDVIEPQFLRQYVIAALQSFTR